MFTLDGFSEMMSNGSVSTATLSAALATALRTVPDWAVLSVFIVLPHIAMRLSRQRVGYYAAGTVLGSILAVMFAYKHFAPENGLSWLLPTATVVQGAVWQAIWFVGYVPGLAAAYAVLTGFGSLAFVHYQLRSEPIEEGSAMTEVVEAALVLIGACSIFVTSLCTLEVAGVAAVARVGVAWWFRTPSHFEVVVAAHEAIERRYAKSVAALDKAEQKVSRLITKRLKR